MSAPESRVPEPSPVGGAWIPLFRVHGVRIHVDPLLVLVLAALVAFGRDADGLVSRFTLVGILLGSVLLHELGHAWVARWRGLTVSGVFVHLLPFAYVERGGPKDELVVSLAGPATSLLIAAACWIPLASGAGFPPLELAPWFADPLALTFAVNALMGAVNLLPAFPLDGGRALRAALALSKPAPVARALAARVGTFVGAFVIALSVFLWRLPESLYVAAIGVYLCVVAWREAART